MISPPFPVRPGDGPPGPSSADHPGRCSDRGPDLHSCLSTARQQRPRTGGLDEIVAVPLVFGCGLLPTNLPSLISGFVIFRVFDILKPPPIRGFERLPEGAGVVADDMIAGLYAGLGCGPDTRPTSGSSSPETCCPPRRLVNCRANLAGNRSGNGLQAAASRGKRPWRQRLSTARRSQQRSAKNSRWTWRHSMLTVESPPTLPRSWSVTIRPAPSTSATSSGPAKKPALRDPAPARPDTSQDQLLDLVNQLNADADIHGILCQLPLPDQIREQAVLDSVSPDKDVDGFHPENVGLIAQGRPRFLP
ncbi:MAG: hypothetical protein Ct9H300mP1_25510 [Planctomycetaceae bacterium]|nr:MAG: hypothetical protein Ct9H300mP1_25510 [Planctomycetaceae bacterium]